MEEIEIREENGYFLWEKGVLGSNIGIVWEKEYAELIIKALKFYDSNKGSITDEELDDYGSFTEYEKIMIKEAYANNPKGTFPNPRCALY